MSISKLWNALVGGGRSLEVGAAADSAPEQDVDDLEAAPPTSDEEDIDDVDLCAQLEEASASLTRQLEILRSPVGLKASPNTDGEKEALQTELDEINQAIADTKTRISAAEGGLPPTE